MSGTLYRASELYRVVVTGSRDGHPGVEAALFRLIEERGCPRLLIVGDAKGVDQQALLWAKQNGVPWEVLRADWDAHGKGAGPRRNGVMVGRASRPGAIGVCAAFPRKGSRGTWDCIRQAHEAGFEVVIADVPKEKP